MPPWEKYQDQQIGEKNPPQNVARPAAPWKKYQTATPELSINPFTNLYSAGERAIDDIGEGAGEIGSLYKREPELAKESQAAPWYDIRPQLKGTLQAGKGLYDIGAGLFSAASAPFTAGAETAGNIVERGQRAAGLQKPLLTSGDVQTSLMGMRPAGAPTGVRLPKAPLDTGLNVPETPQTLAAQHEQLRQPGSPRKAVMYPSGTEAPELPPGMRRHHTERGVFDYDPARITPQEIIQLSSLGRENEILGLGPHSKPDVQARIEAGEKPAVAVERWPDGTEVRAALGTDKTIKEQMAAMKEGALPGSKITSEKIEDVVQARQSVGAAAAPPQTPQSVLPKNELDERLLIRQRRGLAARDLATESASLEPFRREMNAAPQPIKDAFVDAMQGDQAARASLSPGMQGLSDEMARQDYWMTEKFARTWALADMETQDNYFRQMYKNDDALKTFLGGHVEERGVGGRQGASGWTRAKTIPTWKEARALGLSPKYEDPIDLWMADHAEKHQLVAAHEIKEAMQESGVWVYSKHQPAEGWERLGGRFALLPEGGMQAWAPKEIAGVYNRDLSRPWTPWSEAGQNVMAAARRIENASKAARFAISAHHATNTIYENFAFGARRIMENLAEGDPQGAGRALTDMSGVSIWRHGRKGLQMYEGLIQGTEEEKQIVDLLTQANPSVKTTAQDFMYAKGESIPDMWRRGSFGKNYESWKKDMAEALAKGPVKFAGLGFDSTVNVLQKTLDLTSKPVFEQLVPQVKWGNMMRDLSTWLRANPNATQMEQLRAAAKIVDHADDVFGEMMRDNLFWKRWVLQIGDFAALSPTYLFGTARSLGGGLYKVGKKAVMTAALQGKRAPAFRPSSPNYDPSMAYALSIFLTTGAIGAVIQKSLTGEWPKDLRDWLFPRTGGITKIGGKGGALLDYPERLFPHSSVKEGPDIAKASGAEGGTPDIMTYLRPKMGGLAGTAYDLVRNKSDPYGDQIYDAIDVRNLDAAARSIGADISQAGKFAIENLFTPITVSQGLLTPRQEGTAIPGWMRFLGYRPAGMNVVNPEGYRGMLSESNQKAVERRKRHEQTVKRKAGMPITGVEGE